MEEVKSVKKILVERVNVQTEKEDPSCHFHQFSPKTSNRMKPNINSSRQNSRPWSPIQVNE